MRVAILGVGGLGRTLASESGPIVGSLPSCSRTSSGSALGSSRASPVGSRSRRPQLNVENHAAWGGRSKARTSSSTRPSRGTTSDHGGRPRSGRHYLDIAAAGPSEPGGEPGIFAQLARTDDFKEAGRTALVSMGLDPGISKRDGPRRRGTLRGDRRDRIRAGELVTAPGPGYLPLSSREAFLANVLVRPSVWLDGGLAAREPLSEPEEFRFRSSRSPADVPRLARGGGDASPFPREGRWVAWTTNTPSIPTWSGPSSRSTGSASSRTRG